MNLNFRLLARVSPNLYYTPVHLAIAYLEKSVQSNDIHLIEFIMSDKGILRKYKIVFLGDQSGMFRKSYTATFQNTNSTQSERLL